MAADLAAGHGIDLKHDRVSQADSVGGHGSDLGPVRGVADRRSLVVGRGQLVVVVTGTWPAPVVTSGPDAEASYLAASEGYRG